MYIYRDLPARLIDHAPKNPLTHPRIHSFIDLSILLLTYLFIRLLTLFLLFWLGSATDHRSHTPTTTLFQYASGCVIEFNPRMSTTTRLFCFPFWVFHTQKTGYEKGVASLLHDIRSN